MYTVIRRHTYEQLILILVTVIRRHTYDQLILILVYQDLVDRAGVGLVLFFAHVLARPRTKSHEMLSFKNR